MPSKRQFYLYFFLTFLGAGVSVPSASSAATPPLTASASGVPCPEALAVELRIGALDITDQVDSDFINYSGATLFFHLLKSHHPEECLLTEEGIHSSSRRTSLILRKNRGGQLQLIIEGYTRSGKLFAAKSRIAARFTEDWTALLNAYFYDASGTIRKKLGRAEILIEPR